MCKLIFGKKLAIWGKLVCLNSYKKKVFSSCDVGKFFWFFADVKPEMERWNISKNSLNFDEIRNLDCHVSTQHYLEQTKRVFHRAISIWRNHCLIFESAFSSCICWLVEMIWMAVVTWRMLLEFQGTTFWLKNSWI